MPPASAPADPRAVRGAQITLTVALLGAFVFQLPLVVLVAAVVTGIGALAGPSVNPLVAGLAAVTARGRSAPVEADPAPARALDIVAAALLWLATVAFVIGVDLGGWIVALAEAAVAAVYASTGVNAAAELLARMRRDSDEGDSS